MLSGRVPLSTLPSTSRVKSLPAMTLSKKILPETRSELAVAPAGLLVIPAMALISMLLPAIACKCKALPTLCCTTSIFLPACSVRLSLKIVFWFSASPKLSAKIEPFVLVIFTSLARMSPASRTSPLPFTFRLLPSALPTNSIPIALSAFKPKL